MFFEGIFIRAAVPIGTVPASALLVDPAHACLLILILLVLCCGSLWVLSRSSRVVARGASARPQRRSAPTLLPGHRISAKWPPAAGTTRARCSPL
jgi:hypothetical protein